MVVDYIAIFQPLYVSVTRPDGVRDHRFEQLHRASTRINFAGISLCAIAAVVACWPNQKMPVKLLSRAREEAVTFNDRLPDGRGSKDFRNPE